MVRDRLPAPPARVVEIGCGSLGGFVPALRSSGYEGFERIETGQLVDTYARSKFEDTRRKAEKFGARGTTVKAYKPGR